MATKLGFPAINDPRGAGLRDIQQVVANIRERFRTLDGVIGSLQTSAIVAAGSATDITAIKKQINTLQAELDALAAIVAGLDSFSGDFTDPRVEQIAGELLGMQAEIDTLAQPDIEGRVPSVEASLAALQDHVDGIDPVGQTASHAALLHQVQDQIDSINRSYLL